MLVYFTCHLFRLRDMCVYLDIVICRLVKLVRKVLVCLLLFIYVLWVEVSVSMFICVWFRDTST